MKKLYRIFLWIGFGFAACQTWPDLNFLVLTWKAETDVRKTAFSKYIIYIPGWKLLDLVYQQQNERRHHHFLTRPMHGTEILDHKWVHYSPPPLPNKDSFHYFSIFLSLTRHFQQFFRIPDCVLFMPEHWHIQTHQTFIRQYDDR